MKRYLPKCNADGNDPTTSPIKTSRDILIQADEFSLLDEKGPSVDTESAKKNRECFLWKFWGQHKITENNEGIHKPSKSFELEAPQN